MSQNYTIAESYVLPSKGLIYDAPINATVKIRSMTTEDEMRRLAPSDTSYKLMGEVIENCLVEKPGVGVYDMCLGDYQYLLHKLRVVTYGSDYKMTITCPNCGETFEAKLSLDDIEEIPFDEELLKLKVVELPQTKKTIVLKLQTPRMLDNIDLRTQEIKRKNKELSYDPRLSIILQSVIDTVDGEKLSPPALESFVKRLPMRDVNIIIQTVDKLNRGVGLNSAIIVKCGSCGYDAVTNFRLTQEFFRPSLD